jgi:hypothetical protein
LLDSQRSPFLNIGVTFAFFQSLGNVLLSKDKLKSSAINDSLIYGAEIFKILFEILSTPTAFAASQVFSSVSTW